MTSSTARPKANTLNTRTIIHFNVRFSEINYHIITLILVPANIFILIRTLSVPIYSYNYMY